MRELAVQAANDTYTDEDRGEMQNEIDQLLEEINRIADTTQFNTKNLLDGNFNGKIHIGANAGQNLDIAIASMKTDALGSGSGSTSATPATGSLQGVDFTAKTAGAAGNNITIEFVATSAGQSFDISVSGDTITVTLATVDDGSGGFNITSSVDDIVSAINGDTQASALVTASGSGSTTLSAGSVTLSGGVDAGTGAMLKDVKVDTQANADAAISNIQAAIDQVSAERSKLGAYQNRLEHTIANLGTAAENLAAAESRIRDVDMAAQMMEFTKNQILQQAGVAMLAQANMAPQAVLQLLR
jgi:flagellin